MSAGTMQAFEAFKTRFVDKPDVVRGVGGIRCHIVGEVQKVPVSFGDTQARGSTFFCTFRVTPGADYSILFGLDIQVPLRAQISVATRHLSYANAPSATG